MKKLILILLLISRPAWAMQGNVVQFVGMPTGGCTAPSATTLSEGFSETPDNTWTTSGDSYTYGHTLQSGYPDGSCGYGLLHDTAGENGEKIYWDNGSGIAYTTATTIEFTIYVNSATIDVNQNIWILLFGESTFASNYAASVLLANTSGQLQIKAIGTGYSTAVNISTGTWYTCTLYLAATANESYFQVEGGSSTTCDAASECTFTRVDKNKQYLQIGSVSNEGASEAVSFEIGYITVD